MADIQIIVGSMLGGTEYVAEACEEKLLALNHQVTVHLKPCFAQIPFKNQIWLICCSTHGAGDLPDNIQSFVHDLRSCEQDLSTISFLTIGIGNTDYDTFCKAAVDIKKLLITKGCKEITNIFTVDMSQDIDPEQVTTDWINRNKDLL